MKRSTRHFLVLLGWSVMIFIVFVVGFFFDLFLITVGIPPQIATPVASTTVVLLCYLAGKRPDHSCVPTPHIP